MMCVRVLVCVYLDVRVHIPVGVCVRFSYVLHNSMCESANVSAIVFL